MKYFPKVTETNGNATNRIPGSRLRFYICTENSKELLYELVVPARGGKYYCKKHPNGFYGKCYFQYLDDLYAEVARRNGNAN